jgi:hypothetical protein
VDGPAAVIEDEGASCLYSKDKKGIPGLKINFSPGIVVAGITFTIIFSITILFDYQLRHQRDNFFEIRMHY